VIARPIGSGWQTILADLSLILFMVTASALANAPDAPLGPDVPVSHAAPPPPPPPVAPSVRAEPVGVWRAGPDAPPLATWLNDVARDPRLRLTIAVHYAAGGRAGALYQARVLSEAAGPRAADARIVVEPGQPAGASATVGYDGT
jgi:hypothetical protein